MINLKQILLGGSLSFFLSLPLYAQESTDSESAVAPEKEEKLDAATLRENPASPIPYESGRVGDPTCEDRWSTFLPILKIGTS